MFLVLLELIMPKLMYIQGTFIFSEEKIWKGEWAMSASEKKLWGKEGWKAAIHGKVNKLINQYKLIAMYWIF